MPLVDAGTAALLAAAAAIFIFGGLVKGTLGVGMPLVVVPMLSLLMPAPQAMGLLVMPVVLSNLWQAVEDGRIAFTLRRFAPLIGVQLIVTVLAVKFSQNLSIKVINASIAVVVLGAVLMLVVQPKGALTPRQERWAGPLVGGIAGVAGGISSLTGPTIISYLMALRLKRDEFIGSISVIYLCSVVPMYGSMLWYERFGLREVGLSCVALAPMFVGMTLGKAIRHRLSEVVFRRALFAFLAGLSLVLLFK